MMSLRSVSIVWLSAGPISSSGSREGMFALRSPSAISFIVLTTTNCRSSPNASITLAISPISSLRFIFSRMLRWPFLCSLSILTVLRSGTLILRESKNPKTALNKKPIVNMVTSIAKTLW